MITETQKLAELEDLLADPSLRNQNHDKAIQIFRNIKWSDLAKEEAKGGCKIITNPATWNLNDEEIKEKFEKGKYSIFDPIKDKDFQYWLKQSNKDFTIASVMEYCSQKFKPSNLPGLETYRWLYNNPDKIPEKLKDGCQYILPGAAFMLYDRWELASGHWRRENWEYLGLELYRGLGDLEDDNRKTDTFIILWT